MSTYSKANTTAQWFQDDYPGSSMTLTAETMVLVVHTTETTGWPGYNGGATAPNYTGSPPLGSRAGAWRAHFPDERSSRALRNLSGGVETNTLNAVQVELIGTCDPAHAKTWGSRKAGVDYVYWPAANDAQLKWLAGLVADQHKRHGLKLTAPVFKAYPGSYGSSSVRFSYAQWRSFAGICGHQHVPENVHGDPGNINMAKVIPFAKAIVNPPAPPKPAMVTSDISVSLANVRSTPLMKPAQAQADYEVLFSAAAKANDQAVYINEFHASYATVLDAAAKKYGYIVKKQAGLVVAYRRNRWTLSGFAYSLITKGVSGITPNRGVLRLGNTTPAGTRVVFDCTMFPRGWMNPKYAEYATTHPLGVKLAQGIASIVKSQTGTLKSAALVGGDVNIGSLMNWTTYGVRPAVSCMGTPDALDKMMQLHLFVPAGWTAKLVKAEMVPGELNTDHGIVRAHFQVTRPR